MLMALASSRRGAFLSGLGLLFAIVGLASAVIITMQDADDHFRRGELSQQQFGSILAARTAMLANDAVETRAELRRYRRLTQIESNLPGDDEREQARERDVAAELEILIPQLHLPAARAKIDEVIAFTVRREGAEAGYEREEMRKLRERAGWLTAALTVLALGSAILGGYGLSSSNRRLSAEVARRTRELTAIDASRRLFFAKASHELSTPITVIRMEAELALTSPHAGSDVLQQIIAHADLVDHRIAELLALARAEDGRLSLSFAPERLDEIAKTAIGEVSRYATTHGVELLLEVHEPAIVSADRRWLAQALIAVLDNAIKFSDEGGYVHVCVDRTTVTVTDGGVGLLPEAIPMIFDAFYQGETGDKAGSGLGLALARWVVEQHGGAMTAANREGGGCCIGFDLPAHQ
jgi:signal transduction histidine kinase